MMVQMSELAIQGRGTGGIVVGSTVIDNNRKYLSASALFKLMLVVLNCKLAAWLEKNSERRL